MKRIPIFLLTAVILTAVGILASASILQVSSGAWSMASPMNSARSGAAAVLLQDGRILITGGSDGNGPTDSAEFFASNDSFSPAVPMNLPRSGHVAVVLRDGRVLVAGGVTSGGAVTNAAEIFDPIANTWTNVTGGMVEARSAQTASLLQDGRVLIAGGTSGTSISSTMEIFDPNLAVFTVAGLMSSPRTQHAMTVLQDGRVLIVGGNNGTAPVASSDIFDPVAGRISAGPNLSVARFAHSATTLLNGIVVVIGGNNGNANPVQMDATPAELFDPTAATPAFTTLSSNLATPREGHLAFLLPNNNNVLIAGGASGGAAVASAELFLPQQSSTGNWTYAFGSTGSMTTPRGSATGAANQVSSSSLGMQTNGAVLVVGGNDANGAVLNSAEIYGFAMIQTDQAEYQAGTTVAITGNGWQPGETVQIQLVESPLLDTHGPYTVTADANGTISDRSFTADAHNVRVKFTLTAIGAVSQAQMTFTDAPSFTVSGSVNDDVTGAGIPSVTVNFFQSSSSTCGSPLAWIPASTTTAADGTYTATGTGNINTLCAIVTAPANYTASGAVAGTGSTVVSSSEVSTPDGSAGGASTGNNFLVHATGIVETVVASNSGASYSPSAQNALLMAAVTSTGGTVNTGSVSFTILDGATIVGTATSGNVVNGSASVNYALPAHTAAKSYSIQATYNTGGGTSDVTDTNHQLTVSPATLTYTANPVSRSFGTGGLTLTGIVTGFLGDDTLANATSGTLAFTSQATTFSSVGAYAIFGSGLTANSGNYIFIQANSNSAALTITQATPAVSVTGGVFPYSGGPHAATAKAVGVDGLTPVSGSFSFSYTGLGNSSVPINAGIYPVTASFTSSDQNYSNATGSGSVAITSSASQTVTLNNSNTVVAAFGSSSLSSPMSVTSGGTNTVAFATVWVDEGSGSPGTTFNVIATYGGQAMTSAGATSYDYDYAPISSQVFYLTNPPTGTNTLAVNATASSGTIQEVVANLISFNGVNQTTPVRPGTYQTLQSASGVTVGSFTATISSNASDLTLGSLEQTYRFAAPASNQAVDGTGAADFTVGSDHAIIGASSISDTWSFSNPYAYYAYVGFSIQAATGGGGPALTYTADPASRIYGAANPAFTGTVAGFVGGDTLANATTGTATFSSTATTSSNVGRYAIDGSGLNASYGNYAFVQADSNATALTITAATPTVIVTGGAFTYDGNLHAATATAVGVDGLTPVSGTFSFTYTPSGNPIAPSNVGNYSVTATFTSSDPNYSNATGSSSIAITQATLTYTANSVSRAYGAANPLFTGTVTGFVGSDTLVNATTGTAIFTSPATSSSGVGSYAITGSGLTANNGNYTFVSAASNATALTITPAVLTYTANPASRTHGAANPVFTGIVTGFVGTDTLANSTTGVLTFTSPATISDSVGSYAILGSGLTANGGRYTFAQAASNATALTITWPANVTFNNANAAAAVFGSSTFSRPMTVVAGGSSTVAFATVWVDEASGSAGTTFNVTATYGGMAMTSAGPTSYDYNYAPISSQVFYLVNPPTGTNTLVVNASASSGTIQEVVANLVSYNGVNQTTPVRPGSYQTLHSSNEVTVGSFTATIASNASDLTLGAVEATFNFAAPASNQTVDSTNAAGFKVGSDHATTAAASVADTWNFTNPWAYYAYVGLSIQGADGIVPTLTYVAAPASRVAGAANPVFTGTVTGFTGSDTLANSTSGTLTFTSPATTTSSVGNYAINGSGLTSTTGKYLFVQAPSNATALTITPAPAVYYLAPAAGGGNDSNSGLSPSAPWLTPNHPVTCGDVIIAAPSSSYVGGDFGDGHWGAVECAGGNNVVWLKCGTFDACKITSTPTGSIWIDKPYWGVQGWEVNGSNNGDCFVAQPSPTNPVEVHHVIFANDVATDCGAASFGSSNLNQSTTASADYIAIVGTISYDTGSASAVCGEGITLYQPLLSDSNPGTHFFIAGNFAWDALNANPCNGNRPADGEGIILDTFNGIAGGIAPYTGQTVVENNMVLFNGGRGIQIVQNSGGNIYVKQNTAYGNNLDTTQGGYCGEIISNVNTGNTVFSGNLAATSAANTCNGSSWWDYIIGISSTAVQITSGLAYSPAGHTCEAINGGTFSCGAAVLTSINPNFRNPVNPPAPNCGGFSDVPACMASVISNYTPTNPSAVGYGYQVPGPPAYDPLFPQWLCNVNLPPGLVTIGCN